MSTRARHGMRGALAVVAALGVVTACSPQPGQETSHPGQPPAAGDSVLAEWLAGATDLGPSGRAVAVTVALAGAQRPVALDRWAADHGLAVSWQRGDAWAGLSGTAPAMSSALRIPIDDYRGSDGVTFYASPSVAAVPSAVASEVTQVGHLLGHLPLRSHVPGPGLHLDVPPDGLGPKAALQAYQATALADAGYTGKGDTVVFFEWAPAPQADLDAFAEKTGLPRFTPTVVGDFSGADSSAVIETVMDVEVVHALAPDAKIVIVDATPVADTNDRHTIGQNWAKLFDSITSRFPGSVWSLSISVGCDKMFNQADVMPVQSSLQAAHAKGVTAFMASGDTGGLECKAFRNGGFADRPTQDDVGSLGLPSVPAMTIVGGTTLSVDAQNNWAAESTWVDSAAQQGTGGGVDVNWPRPSWQQAQGIENVPDTSHRVVPDVAADADPASGMMIISDGQVQTGGGTSQAAPIWAGLTVLINDYLRAHGGHNVGDINPQLYQIARGAARPAFHDITLGGNAVFAAGPGYDAVTGLGSPNTANLAADLLDLQKGGSS